MTIFGPDISHYQAGLRLATGTPYVAAKSTQGTTYTDPSFLDFKAQAANIGAVFSAYHFLIHGNVAAAQAAYAFKVVGSTPLFLDVEPTGGSNPMLADITAFIDAYRSLGGKVWGVYLPHWYWSSTFGSPSLAELKSRNVVLISSSYPTAGYSETGAGWSAYGGMTPAMWQYTDRQSYCGYLVDFNAYKGTKEQLGALVSGTPVPLQDEEYDVIPQIDSLARNPEGEYAYGLGALGGKGSITFSFDGFGTSANLRVVTWDKNGCKVTGVAFGGVGSSESLHKASVVFPDPASTYAVTVTRMDGSAHPIGVAVP